MLTLIIAEIVLILLGKEEQKTSKYAPIEKWVNDKTKDVQLMLLLNKLMRYLYQEI